MEVRKLRWDVRRSKSSLRRKHVWSVGIRFGYWPCLKAPFVTIDFGTRRLDIWHGLQSYQGRRTSW